MTTVTFSKSNVFLQYIQRAKSELRPLLGAKIEFLMSDYYRRIVSLHGHDVNINCIAWNAEDVLLSRVLLNISGHRFFRTWRKMWSHLRDAEKRHMFSRYFVYVRANRKRFHDLYRVLIQQWEYDRPLSIRKASAIVDFHTSERGRPHSADVYAYIDSRGFSSFREDVENVEFV